MWIGLKNEADDYVDSLINAGGTVDLVNLSMLHGKVARDCVGMLESAITDLTPLSKIDDKRMRFSDAKSHIKRALAKKINSEERISIILESWDILFGWEMIWVPSRKNTVIVLNKLVQLCRNNQETILNVI